MTMFFAKKLNKKGFTLAELLIVVAVIAVLVAIAIPIFTGSVERARYGVHRANARTAKTLGVIAVMNDDGFDANFDPTKVYKATVTYDFTTEQYGAVTVAEETSVAAGHYFVNDNDFASASSHTIGSIKTDGTVTVTYAATFKGEEISSTSTVTW